MQLDAGLESLLESTTIIGKMQGTASLSLKEAYPSKFLRTAHESKCGGASGHTVVHAQ